jgi:hypothetical protein
MRSTWIHSIFSPGRLPRDWLFSSTQALTQRRQPMHLLDVQGIAHQHAGLRLGGIDGDLLAVLGRVAPLEPGAPRPSPASVIRR